MPPRFHGISSSDLMIDPVIGIGPYDQTGCDIGLVRCGERIDPELSRFPGRSRYAGWNIVIIIRTLIVKAAGDTGKQEQEHQHVRKELSVHGIPFFSPIDRVCFHSSPDIYRLWYFPGLNSVELELEGEFLPCRSKCNLFERIMFLRE